VESTVEGSLSLVGEWEEVLSIETGRTLGETGIQLIDCRMLVPT
jgi:hypothetical protein